MSISRRSVLLGAGGLAAAGAAGWAGLDLAQADNSFGLKIVDRKKFTARLHYFRFKTANIAWNPAVNVLLPNGYDGRRRYPVLHLFHGGNIDFRQWHNTGIEKISERSQAIIVMPDAKVGWHCNAVATANGPRNWESFHMNQVLPWVDANFRTIPEGAGRAVAGFSMGGFGAMKYAAKYYGHFNAVSVFSAPTSIRRDGGMVTHWANASGMLDNGLPYGIYGAPWHEDRVSMDNPMENIGRYKGKRVSFYCGNAGDVQESQVRAGQHEFSAALNRAGIRHKHVVHPGGHGADLGKHMAIELPGMLAHLRRAG